MNRLISILLVMLMTPVYGQEQLLPSEKKQQTVVTEPASLYKGFFRAGVAGYFGTVDKYFDASGNKTYFPGNIWGSTYGISMSALYGITDRFQASVSIPYMGSSASQYVLFQIPSTDPTRPDSLPTVRYLRKSSGFGDISVGLKYQIATETASRPAVMVYAEATIPTGEKNPTNVIDARNYTPPVGDGEFKLNVGVGIRKVMYPISYSVFVDYMKKFGGTKIHEPGEAEIPFKSSDFMDVIASFNFHLNDWIAVMNEVSYFYYLNNGTFNNQPVDAPTYLLQYTPRVSFQIKRLRLNEGVLIPLAGQTASADISFMLLVQYTF
ncbi:MAG: transporter [Cyclobacteriaceae bacterium]|nr:transporter [Cyclobacteriaceae bacterium]